MWQIGEEDEDDDNRADSLKKDPSDNVRTVQSSSTTDASHPNPEQHPLVPPSHNDGTGADDDFGDWEDGGKTESPTHR